MIQKTTKGLDGTSFHGQTITASVNELIELFGKSTCIGSIKDKSQYDWHLELNIYHNTFNVFYIFSIYDWKQYREFSKDELIEWHIGSYSLKSSILVKEQLENILYNLRIKKQLVMNPKPNLFQSVKTFINSKDVNAQFTTKEFHNAMSGIEDITPWKRYSNNMFYRSNTYRTYLKRLGFITKIKNGLWEVRVLIPDWLDSGHVHFALFSSTNTPTYKGLTAAQITTKIKSHIDFSLEINKTVKTLDKLEGHIDNIKTHMDINKTEIKNDPLKDFQSAIKTLASEIVGDGGWPNMWFVTTSSNIQSVDNGFSECLPGFEKAESFTEGPFYSYEDACKRYDNIKLDPEFGLGSVCIEDRKIGIVKEKVFEKVTKVVYVEREFDDSSFYTK